MNQNQRTLSLVREVMQIVLLSTFLVILYQPKSIAQTTIEKVDQFVQPFLENGEFDGYILVQYEGQILLSKSYTTLGDEFKDETPFLIGSLTKTLTAEGIGNFIESGQITLKSPLSDYFPKIPQAEKINIRHLLTHRSGVPDYYSIDEFRTARTTPVSLKDFGDWVSKHPLAFDPGRGNGYSNSGYNLLASIIETLSGKSYNEYLESEVFERLDMAKSASLSSDAYPYIPKGFEPGPLPELIKAPQTTHPSWLVGSGSVYASASDLLKWSNEIKSRLINQPKWKPYGWGIRKRGKELYLEQTGRIPGYASSLQIYPESNLVAIALSRIESEAVNMLTKGISALVMGEEVSVPKVRELVNLSNEVIKGYEGVYQITPDFLITVAVQDGYLGVATGKGDNLSYGTLDALGNDNFYFRVGNTTISFERDSNGVVTGLIWGGGGPFPKL